MNIQNEFLDIEHKIEALNATLNQLSSNAQTFTVILGATGSGKSSLTNYMHDAQLTYKKVGPSYQINFKNSENSQKLPQMGNQKQSCTKIPNICQNKSRKTADLIGWFDTQKPSQQIINAFSNASILKKGKKIKIVMVCEINSLIVQRGGIFVQILKILEQVFKNDFQRIIDSTMIIFSKVNTEDFELADIKDQISKIMQLNENLNKSTKRLLEYVIQKDRVEIFPTPDKITDHIQKIKNKIQTVKEATLNYDSQISLSAQAINFRNSFESVLAQKTKSITDQYSQIMRSKFIHQAYYYSYSLNTPISNMRSIQNLAVQMINQKQNQDQWTYSLNNFNSLSNCPQVVAQKGLNHIKMIKFCKKLNKNIASEYLKFVQLLKSLTNQLISNLEQQKYKLYLEEQKKILQQRQRQQRARQEAEDLRRRQQLEVRQKQYKRQKQEQLKKYQQQLENERAQREIQHRKQLQRLQIDRKIANLRYQISNLNGFWRVAFAALLQNTIAVLQRQKSLI